MKPAIIGLAYDSQVHCVSCTKKHFKIPVIEKVPSNLTDSKGHEVRPVIGWNPESEQKCFNCGISL